MFTLETFQRQLSAVMETLVEVAVTELSRLLDQCPANVMAAPHRTAPARVTLPAVKNQEVAREATSPEERQQFNKYITVTHTHTHVT